MEKPDHLCPVCGSNATRQVTRQELQERDSGQDPMVVVMPRTCAHCGHMWDPAPSPGMCGLIAAAGAIGFLIGAALFAGGLWILVQSKLAPQGGANNLRNQVAVAGIALLGLLLAGRSGAVCRRYLRLARQQEPSN